MTRPFYETAEDRKNERKLAQTQEYLETMLKGGDIAAWDWHLTDGRANVSDSYFTHHKSPRFN